MIKVKGEPVLSKEFLHKEGMAFLRKEIDRRVTKPVTKVPAVTKGRPKRYETPAAKQAAYRARKANG